jgi:hypothetical protein
MSDASSDLGAIRAGPVERDLEQVPSPSPTHPALLPSHYVDAAPRGGSIFRFLLFTTTHRRRVQSGR